MKVAVISYNAILPERDNGWVTDSLFMIQSDRGTMFGAPQVGFGTSEKLREMRYDGINVVAQIVKGHWQLLAEALQSLDKVFIYVGDNGSEGTIQHAAENGLNPSKAVFVLCDCNEHAKRSLISANGFTESHVIMCECSGRRTMQRIANNFLESGRLPV